MRKVLVTGGAGFIGSHLVDRSLWILETIAEAAHERFKYLAKER